MQFDGAKTVREIAIEMPGATRVFEKLGIDYCCGGARPLDEACRAAGVTLAEVTDAFQLSEALGQALAEARDWRAESLASLVAHITERHHVFTREEMARIEPLLAKVARVYAERRPEMARLQELFAALQADLLPHMMKEENILFPYVVALEAAVAAGGRVPLPMFGSVRNPVRMMMYEHDSAGELLREIRQLTGDFQPPEDACVSFRTLYGALEGLEKDLHQHIHLENNILFPRAIELEVECRARDAAGVESWHLPAGTKA